MFFSQSVPALPAPQLSGFFAVPSVASASAFAGIEGTAKNRVSRFLSGFVFCRYGNENTENRQKQSCSVSTTATNRHKCR